MAIEGSSDDKKVSKRGFFKEPLTEWCLGTKNGSSMASLEETFEAPLFLRVYRNLGLMSCSSASLSVTKPEY